jgi:uncharacterized protein YxjI
MRYVMRQKLWSWGNDFTIKDDAGVDRFYVDGKVISLRQEMVFEDMDRRPLATVRKRLLSIGNVYDVYHGDQLFAVVKENWLPLVRYRFTVDVGNDGPGPGDLSITGDVWNHEYTFEEAGQTVAVVSKRWFSWTDTFGVDVADGADDVLVLACTAVVDLCTRKKDER